MSWAHADRLWLLVALVALAIVLARLAAGRRAALARFAEAGLVERLVDHFDSHRRAQRLLARVAALTLLLVALAGPRWGFRWEEVRREGIDLIVALDTSRSMLAGDVQPNRLERAKLAVLDLVRMLDGDRIGLVAFAGAAFLECPLTLDYAAFERSLRALDVGIIPRGGTALGAAIETSLASFEARQGKHQALLLITDGENHEGNVEEAAARATEAGVKGYTVGIGTLEGELLPADARGFFKDRQGRVVKSRLDEEPLRRIALATGGAYVRGAGPALGLDELFDGYIAKMERREIESALERRYEERFQIPAAVALLLLLLEGVLEAPRRASSRSRWFARLRSPRGVAGVALVILPLLVGWSFGPNGPAAEGNRLYETGEYDEAIERYRQGLVDEPDSSLLRYNLGTALYRAARYQEAAGAFERVVAAGEPAYVAHAAHNLGDALYRVGQASAAEAPQTAIESYRAALVAYRRAMAADPRDEDPKFSHELVAARLRELEEQLENQQQDQQQDQQQQDDQQEAGEDGESPREQQQEDEQPPSEEQQGAEDADQSEDDRDAQAAPDDEQGAGQEPNDAPEAGEEAAQDHSAAADATDEPQPQGEPPAGTGAVADGEQAIDRRAARAILDTARSEELGPDDVDRSVGMAGVAEPVKDW